MIQGIIWWIRPKWEVSANVGLREGKVGSFPETYNDPRDHLMDLPQVRSKC